MPPLIVVVGSLNIDLIAAVPSLPKPGETVAATSLLRRFGGKGANQALAASRLGAKVAMIGCVGNDSDGKEYRERFQSFGIEMSAVSMKSRLPTGTALIAVDRHGESQIVVVPGANFTLTPLAIRAHQAALAAASALLIQLEVPIDAVLESMRLARRHRVPVIFNPSPRRADIPWGAIPLEFVVVNEPEAHALLGFLPPRASRRIQRRAAPILRERGIGTLIVTRGAHPTLSLSASHRSETAVPQVQPVDTVGAGDAFAGAFAAGLACGLPLDEAIRRANYAGALATLKPGAQEALPTLAQVTRAAKSAAPPSRLPRSQSRKPNPDSASSQLAR